MTEGGMRPNWQTRLPSSAIRSSEKVGGDWSWKTGKKRCAPESAAAVTPRKYISVDIKAAPAAKETSTFRRPERSTRAHAEMLISNPNRPTSLTIPAAPLPITNNALDQLRDSHANH